MKYLKLRSKTYYYRRRIPNYLSNKVSINIIYRPLSRDRHTALKLAARYDHLFNLLEISTQLGEDITQLLRELGVGNAPATKSDTAIDVFKAYLDAQNVNEKRLAKITNFISVFKILIPNITTINMLNLDELKARIMKMPKRSSNKYRTMSVEELVKVDAPHNMRLGTETINNYIKTLNSLLMFAYERDMMDKHFTVKTVRSTTTAREQRSSIDPTRISAILEQARSVQLSSAYRLLYLTGMRPSEAYKCKLTTVDGIECFDLTDRSIPLKTQSSYRLIPVHKSITDPYQALDDLRSFKIQNLGRQFKKDSNGEDLYSLRHSFADNLSKSVEPHLITELLGHAHQDMTKSRYIKGFGVKVLSKAVQAL